MHMRPLGGSGIMASAVGFGAWAIGGWMWGGSEEKDAIAAIHAALDNGINLIDTAPVYGMGRSEEIVGKALKGAYRHKAVLATKCALEWDGTAKGGTYHFGADDFGKAEGDNPQYRIMRNGRPEVIRKELEDSLRRLRTDVIDLYQTHWQDPGTPIEDTMAELLKLQREGKIRAIGCSNATLEDMDRYRSVGRLDVDQEKYSMLDRGHEKDNLPYCAEHGVAYLAYSPLAQGLLTGAVGPDRQFKPTDNRNKLPRFSVDNRVKVGAFLEAIRPIADDYRLSLGQLVTAWTIAQPGCSHALLGARTPKQVEENAKGGAVTLQPGAIAAITEKVETMLASVV